jgi:hypothetical protein
MKSFALLRLDDDRLLLEFRHLRLNVSIVFIPGEGLYDIFDIVVLLLRKFGTTFDDDFIACYTIVGLIVN